MTYRVEFSRRAESDAYEAYRFIAQDSVANADRWFSRLVRAVESLEASPRRCRRAPENRYFEEDIRHLMFGVYRILFTVRKDTVYVLHIRHGSRRAMRPEE